VSAPPALTRAGLGLLAALAGLAVADLAQALLNVRVHPVTAVGEAVIELTPGPVVEVAIAVAGRWDKPLLVGGVTAAVLLFGVAAAVLAARSRWAGALLVVAVGAMGAVAATTRPGAGSGDLVPAAAGLVTWLVALEVLVGAPRGASTQPPADPTTADADAGADVDRRPGRRTVLLRAGAVAGLTVLAGAGGRWAGRARAGVEASRRLLRIPATRGAVPDGAELPGLVDQGLSPWRTSNADFYRIDTALAVPTIDPSAWRLRIHGLVDRPLEIGYDDLVAGELTEAWVTLCCVSNPVGGDLIGNAWWSGVRVADLLRRVGVRPDADAVLQTSEDGWTCATPLETLTDDRNALLAVAMNGQPLPLEHGFPVRMVVPGLYGYVSATKWLVDLEVTRFDRVEAYWTRRGWSERGPIRTMSRIDVPRSGATLPAGPVVVAGVAWAQHTGIEAVEVSLDGGPWVPATLGGTAPGEDRDDTWVQWRAEVDAPAGDHLVSVRATDRTGETQTSVRRDVVPDGATGWHQRDFRTT